MSLLQTIIILGSAIFMALILNTISHAWAIKHMSVRQRSIYVFPLCVLNGYLFAALTLALLRPELLASASLRSTQHAWIFVSGIVMLLSGIYYSAFAPEISEAQQALADHGNRWSHWFLPRRPHPARFRQIGIFLIVGGMFLCSNVFAF